MGTRARRTGESAGFWRLTVLVALMASASVPLAAGENCTSEPEPLSELPASFEGELPCADCPGIHYRLDLFSDRVFFLRMTYLGRGAGAISDFLGTWALAAEKGRLSLFTGEKAPVFFRVVNADTLRKLDIEGHDIDSTLNYDLRRKEGLALLEVRVTMRGMYRYMADAALFEECVSGRRFQVAQEGDNLALERAYLDARREPGEPLLVSLQGRIAERPAMEGDAMVLTVVPERFLGVRPGETCGARRPTAKLENTYWKLTRLGNEPVLIGAMQREPHVVLHSADLRVAGFSGCNNINGSFKVDDDQISFGPMATTMLACVEGADTERAFLKALEGVSTWRVIGEHLDFLSSAGELVARFEARYME
jgi:copper homeostasis protein (lipoprotein)